MFDWARVPERDERRPWPGTTPQPRQAYVKALLAKICEGYKYITDLRCFLVKHPALVLEIGFQPVLDTSQAFGFDVERTVPSARWLRHQQQTLENGLLQNLLAGTVRDLRAEIPNLGETVSTDVKHIYAWVKENNPKEHLPHRYDPERQPTGDADCRLGVKRSHNQETPDGATPERKEYLWGYGTGIAAATHPVYGDVVLAEVTRPFNETDVTYFQPVRQRTVAVLGFPPKNWTADAAYDAWYVYQAAAEQGGIAAVPLNRRGHPLPQLDPRGFPLCPGQLAMFPSYPYAHPDGYQAQVLRCPLLFPKPNGQTCDHDQFSKGPGCVKHINLELGGRMRLTLDRQSETYRALYNQRTAAERINSQAVALGIERPRVRNMRSVRNLNTVTYLVINARALKRVRQINARSPTPRPALC